MQDVGDAETTALPLKGNPCLQPPPQRPDHVSVLSEGGLLPVSHAGVVSLYRGCLNSQEPKRG